MSRPSRHLDKALIKAGKQIIIKGGASSAISIRKVCAKAKVNTGMFNYFFKNRDNFLKIVHDELYEDLFAEMQSAALQGTSSVEKLKIALLTLGKITRERRQMFRALITDTLNKEKVISIITKDFFPKDLVFLIGLVGECKKDGYISSDIDDGQIIGLLLPSIMLPSVFGQEIFKTGKQNIPDLDLRDISTHEATTERIDLILKGLK